MSKGTEVDGRVWATADQVKLRARTLLASNPVLLKVTLEALIASVVEIRGKICQIKSILLELEAGLPQFEMLCPANLTFILQLFNEIVGVAVKNVDFLQQLLFRDDLEGNISAHWTIDIDWSVALTLPSFLWCPALLLHNPEILHWNKWDLLLGQE